MSHYTDKVIEKLIKERKEKSIGAIIGIFIIAIILIIFFPLINFWVAYFFGWIVKILIGKYIVAGLAFLNINIPLDKIPLLAGVLSWLGGFFKTVNIKYK